jgi:hypothetical protein
LTPPLTLSLVVDTAVAIGRHAGSHFLSRERK